MIYRFDEKAWQEVIGAYETYEAAKPGLGAEFVEELDLAIARIMHDPESYAFIAPETRSLSTRRFPYSIIYRIEWETQEVVIYAVAHASQRQGYWRNRMSPE